MTNSRVLGTVFSGLIAAAALWPNAAAAAKRMVFESVFLQLNGRGTTIRVGRKGAGGALTSFGSHVLVLTHEGKVYAAKSAENIRQLTGIKLPDNGYAAYARAARSKEFRALNHVTAWHRYNDILYYRSGVGPDARHGLALSYTEFFDDRKCYGTTVAVLPLDQAVTSALQIKAKPDDWKVIFRTKPCLPLKKEMRALEGHLAGGRMAFSAPSTLHLGSGDYHWDGVYAPKALSQNPDNSYGKVINVDVETGKAEQITLGNRNMQGVAVDRRGRIWVTEHGMRGGDELNLIKRGKNYGWPVETLGTRENKLPMPNTLSYGRHETHEPPVHAWLPSVGISGLTLVKGFHPSWDGDLLAASLSGEALWRIRIRGERAMFVERIQLEIRVRYVHQHTDGRIVIWTDDKQLIFFSPGQQDFATQFIDAQIKEMKLSGSDRRKLATAVEQCMQCHSLVSGNHDKSPSLARVFGADIGDTGFGGYSTGLRARRGTWTKANLIAYLSDPAAFAPGTTMPNPSIGGRRLTAAMVDLLEAIKDQAE